MKRLIEKLKLMFVRQPRLQQPVVSSRFTITYCVDGNLGTVQSWECVAESKEMAEYDFWVDTIHFIPIFCLSSKMAANVEALAKWGHFSTTAKLKNKS